MYDYDDAVLSCFLRNQLQLFPEKVAENLEEVDEFLTDCLAVVLHSAKEVYEYFEEVGVDLEGKEEDEIHELDEVFKVGDGRYLVVEC